MTDQAQLSKPEIIALPGDNAELPAKLLERDIYTNPERFQKAMMLGSLILTDIITEDRKDENDPKKTIPADTKEVKDAKALASGLKRILNDSELRRAIWFDDDTEARMTQDDEHRKLKQTTPRTEKVLKDLRFRQFSIFVDRVVEFQAQDKTTSKKSLRKTG